MNESRTECDPVESYVRASIGHRPKVPEKKKKKKKRVKKEGLLFAKKKKKRKKTDSVSFFLSFSADPQIKRNR